MYIYHALQSSRLSRIPEHITTIIQVRVTSAKKLNEILKLGMNNSQVING